MIWVAVGVIVFVFALNAFFVVRGTRPCGGNGTFCMPCIACKNCGPKCGCVFCGGSMCRTHPKRRVSP